MAGIVAASIAVPSPGTAPNNSVAGYVTAQAVALSTTPTGAAYVWALAVPSGSSIARSGLTTASGATTGFTPDVAGEYVVTCTVDSVTLYTLLMAVTAVTAVNATGATRYLPVTDASVGAPATGCVLYMSSSTTPNKLSVKFPDNSIQRLTT